MKDIIMNEIQYYYPKTLHKIINSVGGMFSNIKIFKYDTNMNPTAKIDVPVICNNNNIRNVIGNSNDATEYHSSIPRIVFSLVDYKLNENRIMSPLNTRAFLNEQVNTHLNADGLPRFVLDYTPLPYDYIFNIDFIGNTIGEIAQISENFFPYFMPGNTSVRIREFDFMNLKRNLLCVMESGNTMLEKVNEKNELYVHKKSIKLTVKGHMYRPIEMTEQITKIIFQLYNTQIKNEDHLFSRMIRYVNDDDYITLANGVDIRLDGSRLIHEEDGRSAGIEPFEDKIETIDIPPVEEIRVRETEWVIPDYLMETIEETIENKEKEDEEDCECECPNKEEETIIEEDIPEPQPEGRRSVRRRPRNNQGDS